MVVDRSIIFFFFFFYILNVIRGVLCDEVVGEKKPYWPKSGSIKLLETQQFFYLALSQMNWEDPENWNLFSFLPRRWHMSLRRLYVEFEKKPSYHLETNNIFFIPSWCYTIQYKEELLSCIKIALQDKMGDNPIMEHVVFSKMSPMHLDVKHFWSINRPLISFTVAVYCKSFAQMILFKVPR